METGEDSEEAIGADFVEAEVVHLAVVVEVSDFVWSLWLPVFWVCIMVLSFCLASIRRLCCVGSCC